MSVSMTWPNIQLPGGCDETTEDPALRSEMEAGIVKSRSRYTRMRRSWQLVWENMKGADYRTLRDFYKQVSGGSMSFNWEHPLEKIAFEVRFNGSLAARHTCRDCWGVEILLEEV